MRRLANLFLLLFLASALLGICDELLRLLFELNLLSGLRQLIWLGCLFFGAIVYLGFGFNRHLPKVILLPLFFWLFWGLVDYRPLDTLAGEWYRLYAACGQLIFGVLLLKLNRRSNYKSLLLVPSQFAGPSFSGPRLLSFCLINIVVFPIALLLIGYSTLDRLVETNTAGFVQLKPTGLYMTERIYRRGDKQIRLAGMIHLGQKNYYDELTASIPQQHTLILAEGVSDEDGLLTERFGYGKIADLLGLTSQEQVRFHGRLIDTAELDKPVAARTGGPDILRADIDLREFDPRSIEVLNALAKYVLNAESLMEGYLEFNRWAGEHATADVNSVLMDDLIYKRNRSVAGYLEKALQQYDTLIIPWGALHMKGIEQAVKEKEFILAESRERLSIDFLLLPYGQLWDNLTGVEK